MSGTSYSIEGIGDVSRRVRRNPTFEPRRNPNFDRSYYVLWNRISDDTTVHDLVMCGEVSPSHAIVILQELLKTGALVTESNWTSEKRLTTWPDAKVINRSIPSVCFARGR